MKTANRRKIRSHTKLFLLFIATFLIPLIAITTVSWQLLYKQMQQQALLSDKREISQLGYSINAELTKVVSLGHLISANRSLHSYLSAYSSGEVSLDYAKQAIHALLKQYSPMLFSMNSLSPSITVVTDNGVVFGEEIDASLLQSNAFKEAIAKFKTSYNQYESVWLSDAQLFGIEIPSHESCIYALHTLRNPNSWENMGTIVFRIRQSRLLSQYMGSVKDYQNIYIIDNEGNILSEMECLGDIATPAETYSGFLDIRDTLLTEQEGMQQIVTVYGLPTTRWRILSVSDLKGPMTGFYQVGSGFILAVAGCALLSLLLSYLFSRRFIQPVLALKDQMQQVKHGDLSARVKVASQDEIGELSQLFNEMVERIEKLMEQVVAEQRAKRKADILSLQTQINPHFLYNTMASIRYMVLADNKQNAETIILALNRILKYALSDTHEFISVNMELDQLGNYLTIEKFSFSTPLQVDIRVDDKLGDCKTIKLLLQPIVENALLHGLKGKTDNPTLKISVRAAENDLLFIVEDNGSGFDPATLKLRKPPIQDSHHIGLQNVDKRIKLHFGTAYGMKIESEIGKGTTVTLRIPKITEKEEGSYEYPDRR